MQHISDWKMEIWSVVSEHWGLIFNLNACCMHVVYQSDAFSNLLFAFRPTKSFWNSLLSCNTFPHLQHMLLVIRICSGTLQLFMRKYFLKDNYAFFACHKWLDLQKWAYQMNFHNLVLKLNINLQTNKWCWCSLPWWNFRSYHFPIWSYEFSKLVTTHGRSMATFPNPVTYICLTKKISQGGVFLDMLTILWKYPFFMMMKLSTIFLGPTLFALD